jgi:hypothetical protein
MAALGTCVLSGLSAFAVVLDVACSSGASAGNGSGNAPDSAVSTGPASDAGSSDAGSSAGEAGDEMATNPDQACAAMDASACSSCCYNNHTSGANVASSAFYSCVCTPANCQTQCAQTDCNSSPDAGFPEAGDPCDLCEQQAAPYDGGGACGPQITAACNASTDCVAFFLCENNCP